MNTNAVLMVLIFVGIHMKVQKMFEVHLNRQNAKHSHTGLRAVFQHCLCRLFALVVILSAYTSATHIQSFISSSWEIGRAHV